MLIVAIILVVIAYVAITKVGLNIKGTGNSQASKDNFAVEFIGEPITGGKGKTIAKINTTKKSEGTINVTGLIFKGDTATATYTLQNLSQDLSADLTTKVTNVDESTFEVTCKLESDLLKPKETTTLTVAIKSLKNQIDENTEITNSDIGISIIAEPKQEETTVEKTTAQEANVTIPYLPTGFTQVANTNLSTGLIIQDSKENQYAWVEVPKTAKVYPTAGLNITTFTDDEYKK